ncbi:hypothetical protein [Lentzea guizhouensis]|uniref:hypothetical protein n=1 Tax=Lentzea guizhouensis TaxID=1586287 RepID=UPI0012B68AC5|nr:hypothetical protein [Lentzea guizhouensis]
MCRGPAEHLQVTVSTAAIVCAHDRSFPALFADRLRATAVVRELPGSHSPFLIRPRELAEVVGEVTERL